MTRTKIRMLSLLGATILATALLPAMPALAAPGCTVDAGNATLNVTASEATRIVRGGSNGEDIQVTPAAGGSDACPSTQGDEHTVFDIDTIVVSGSSPVTIDMSGGDFSPGFNQEPGTDEIEIFIASSSVELTIQGGTSSDRWAFGAKDSNPPVQSNDAPHGDKVGINLNPLSTADADPDILSGTRAAPTDLLVAKITANGAEGSDTFIQGEEETEIMNGGTGVDAVDYSTRTVTVTVTLDNDAGDGAAGEDDTVSPDIERVEGGSGDDIIDARLADLATNFLNGNEGNDELHGGPGSDSLLGDDPQAPASTEPGDDELNGNEGRDTLNGGPGTDVENGGDGKDTFNQGAAANGDDSMAGGDGRDTVKYNLRTATVTIDAAPGGDGAATEDDSVATDIEVRIGGKGDDTLVAPNGANYTLSGGAGVDTLTGGDGKDTLSGGDGSDAQMRGGLGNDTLNGGDGNEVMTGGAGRDTLNGGDGKDEMNGEAGQDRLSGGGGSDKLWGDGSNPNVRDTLIGGSPTTGPDGDTCERDTKDVRNGCEGRATGTAPSSA